MANIAITKSSELATNVGNSVVTPKGVIFKIDLWQSAKQHGLNADGSAYGSRMQITMSDGTKREFFSCSYKGSETLTKFYNEVGIETSGKSGGDKPRKPLGQKLDELYNNAKEAGKTQTLLNFVLSLDDCPEWVTKAFKAEEQRRKEEEEKRRRAEEDREFERLLKARGYSLKDLKSKK